MDAAAMFRILDAEIAAKSARVAELEARVSLLEAENARLRKALGREGAIDRTGEEGPRSGRFGGVLRGSRHEDEAAEKKLGGSAACDVIEVSDDEEGPAAVVSIRGRTPEEGVAAVPTPRKRAARAVTGESEDEDDAGAGGGGGSSSKENSVGLEDDDVLVSPRGRKRAAARVVTSDSEDEDLNSGELGSGEDGVDDQEGGGKPSKKRGFCGISDSDDEDATEGVDVVTPNPKAAASPAQVESGEDEDDVVPICHVLKKMRKKRDDDELGETKGCSTPATRRSARLAKNQSTKVDRRTARRALNFVEPKESERSEDDMEDDEDMEEFINDDDSSENDTESAEESCDEPQVSGTSVLNEEPSRRPEDSDSEVDYADVMARIGRKNKDKDWKFEGDMLAAVDERPELCLKAVCALYRKQTEEEQMHKATFVNEGFNQIDALRGSRIAEFLLDGDLYGPLKKTIADLEQYDRSAIGFCRKVASRYSKQLFAIYQNKEDPYFHP
ncbi:hypothetical protein HU200_066686 [Digitaria exilis]|uniref:Uncharacterized protein n=1 Tax=Digitaria exilis TaxID=1010633 RepID=A0A834ZWM2_9POAL|nr:hypothetical protein HU200_066686 [Digitaria exilis]CAB3475729.1 unnamed protein product [Digitaria exilis]